MRASRVTEEQIIGKLKEQSGLLPVSWTPR